MRKYIFILVCSLVFLLVYSLVFLGVGSEKKEASTLPLEVIDVSEVSNFREKCLEVARKDYAKEIGDKILQYTWDWYESREKFTKDDMLNNICRIDVCEENYKIERANSYTYVEEEYAGRNIKCQDYNFHLK